MPPGRLVDRPRPPSEGHKVREEHGCHSAWFSLDVKQRPCSQPAVLWEIPVQELVPGTEFNFNGHWPSHLKAETRVGPVPSPVATAEFSKFAGILSTALSQHHLSGFGIAQLEFHHQKLWFSIC